MFEAACVHGRSLSRITQSVLTKALTTGEIPCEDRTIYVSVLAVCPISHPHSPAVVLTVTLRTVYRHSEEILGTNGAQRTFPPSAQLGMPLTIAIRRWRISRQLSLHIRVVKPRLPTYVSSALPVEVFGCVAVLQTAHVKARQIMIQPQPWSVSRDNGLIFHLSNNVLSSRSVLPFFPPPLYLVLNAQTPPGIQSGSPASVFRLVSND
jgi:hypothetical protein